MAGKVRRIDWSPDEWLSGTRGVLTITELAVYDVVLNMIYSRGGRAPHDEGFIAGHFKSEGKRQARAALTMHTRRALDQLLRLGKLRLSPDGLWLTNGRADVELGKAGERIVGAHRAGVASGKARRARGTPNGTPNAHPTPHPGIPVSSPSKGLAGTTVRNHQPPYDSSLRESSTEAARADRPATDGPPARAPDTAPRSTAEQVAALATAHRERHKKLAKQSSASDQRLVELARKFHGEKPS